jgi:hypothetical protein
MGIDLIWWDSAGVRVDATNDEAFLVSAAIGRVREDRSRDALLVSTIDPYGRTRFMTGQAPRLLREFEVLRQESADVDTRIALGHVIAILRAAAGTTDDWLEFDGD